MSDFRPLPTQAALRRLFTYDAKTGTLRWRVQPRGRVCAGDPAGSPGPRGYLRVKIEGVDYYLHRIIWQFVHGDLQADVEIDHRDHDKANNRIRNLRKAAHADNCLNLPTRSNNTSGHPGVGWHAAAGKWCARIQRAGRRVNLGLFDRIEDAVAARAEACRAVFGEFAPRGGR